MRLARKQMEEGQPQQAEAAWRRAIQSNPADPAPRQALLKFLIGEKRLNEAFTLTEASLKYAPKDPNLLVDRGVLATQLGHADQAMANWEAALAVDPGQSLAHLYLAHEFDVEGNPQAAASHYNAFLQNVVRQAPQNRPAPEGVIAVALRMADCQARSSQPELAMKSYHLAETLAAQTRLPKLESVADVNEADLQARAGKVDEALKLYQHALQLDESAADNTASALDWFAYGRFLDEAGFPPRLAYACMVKSESLSQSLPKEAIPESVVSTRTQVEKRLASTPSVAGLRRDPEPALREALALRR